MILIDRDAQTDRAPALRWVNASVEAIFRKLGATMPKGTLTPVRGVAFHSADTDKRQEVRVAAGTAHLVDLSALRAALLVAASGAGAAFEGGTAAVRVRMMETDVAAECGEGPPRTARLLILASGACSDAAASAGLPLRPPSPGRFAAQLDWPVGRGSTLPAGVLQFVLGLERGAGLATFWSTGEREVVTVFATTEAAARTRLAVLLRSLADRLGAVLPGQAAPERAAIVPMPVGHALEIESHVGKRTVAIGDAGGFIANATCEGVYPAMWSAEIAAATVEAALKGAQPQDALREFDTQWRTTMADYLRPPNADLQFLLPLVFSNRQMAERLAGAFLRGENL